MIDLNEEDDIRIKYLISLKTIEKGEVQEMENYIRKYIDHSCHICAHCSSQIIFAHKRLISWYNKAVLGQ